MTSKNKVVQNAIRAVARNAVDKDLAKMLAGKSKDLQSEMMAVRKGMKMATSMAKNIIKECRGNAELEGSSIFAGANAALKACDDFDMASSRYFSLGPFKF